MAQAPATPKLKRAALLAAAALSPALARRLSPAPSEQAALCRFLRRRGYRIRGKVLPHAGARSAQAAS